MNDNTREDRAKLKAASKASQEIAERLAAELLGSELDPPVMMITLTAIVIGVASILCAGNEEPAIDALAQHAKEFIRLRRESFKEETTH